MTTKEAIRYFETIQTHVDMSAITGLEANEAINMAIKALSEQPEWIPCSERLPRIGEAVLLSEPNDMFIAEYHGNGSPEGLWLLDGIHHYIADTFGCAWMPLPKPYQAERREDV